MKEILFKGKTYNGNWEEGNLIVTGDECYILSQKSELTGCFLFLEFPLGY